MRPIAAQSKPVAIVNDAFVRRFLGETANAAVDPDDGGAELSRNRL